MFVTYFMVDWKEEKVRPSGRLCTECGNEMGSLEANVGAGQTAFEGLVCHNCKRLVWLRMT